MSSYSNPTAPSGYKPPQENNNDEDNTTKKGGGLKQDDFRKLLMTPRTGPPATPSRGSFAPKTPRPNAAPGGFVKPEMPSSKSKKKWKKPSTEETEKEEPKYRDRAAERRTGANPDYAETEQILATLKAAEEQDQSMAYEQSKYLGGDVEHTHLVKGLDFALLNKVKTQLDKPEEGDEEKKPTVEVRDEEIELAAEMGRVERGKEEFQEELELTSTLAENIYDVAVVQARKKTAAKNELFRAGRLAYVFELADELGGYRDAFAIPTTLIRSKAGLSGQTEPGASDIVLDKIINVMAQLRTARPEEKKKAKKEKKKAAHVEPVPKLPVIAAEDEDDLFADAGVDYVEGLHDDELPEPSKVETNDEKNESRPNENDDDEAFVPQRPPEDFDVDAAFAPERPPEDFDMEAAFAPQRPPEDFDVEAAFAPQRPPEDFDVEAAFAPERPPEDYDVESAFAAPQNPPPPKTQHVEATQLPSQTPKRVNYFGEDAEDYMDTGDASTEKSRKQFVASLLQKSAVSEKSVSTSLEFVPGFRRADVGAKKFGTAMEEDAYEADYSSFGLGKTSFGKIGTTATSSSSSSSAEGKNPPTGNTVTESSGKRSVMSFIPTTPASASQKRSRTEPDASAIPLSRKDRTDPNEEEDRSKKPRRDRAKDKLNRDFQALDRFMSTKYGAGLNNGKEDGKKESGEKKTDGGSGNRRERRAAMRGGKK